MKNKTITICIAALFLIFSGAAFAASPDYSGSWTLDKAKSEGLPPGMDQTMTVKQTGDKISIEIKIITDKGEQVSSVSYTLDGKEREISPKMSNDLVAKGKQSAKLTADGNIEIQETVSVDLPDGAQTIQKTTKWSLSADGKTLKIDSVQQTPNGNREVKRTFIKK